MAVTVTVTAINCFALPPRGSHLWIRRMSQTAVRDRAVNRRRVRAGHLVGRRLQPAVEVVRRGPSAQVRVSAPLQADAR